MEENKLNNQEKLFGRNKFLSPVIFEGNLKDIGKVRNIEIVNSTDVQKRNKYTKFLFKKPPAASLILLGWSG